MPYELTCPSCNARLLLKEDIDNPALICPRCLGRVPPPPTMHRSTSTAVRVPKSLPVAIGKEVEQSTAAGKFLAVALSILIAVSLFVLFGRPTPSLPPGVGEGLLLLVPMALVIGLTALILVPMGRWLGRETQRKEGESSFGHTLRSLFIVGLFLILAPFAFFIVVGTVCFATIAVVQGVAGP
jgi:hypothetical protein